MRLYYGAVANTPYIIDITQGASGDWRLCVIFPPPYNILDGVLGTVLEQGQILWHLDIAGRLRSDYPDPHGQKLSSIATEDKHRIEDIVMRLWKIKLFL